MGRYSTLLRATVFGTAWLAATCCHAEIKFVSGPLPAAGDFDLDKRTRRSLSGVACPVIVGGRHICLVAFDEGAEARTIEIDESQYTAHKKSIGLGPNDTEMDSEAVAADDRFYYVSGSHANKRETCAANDESHRVVRIAYDPATGLPLRKKGELQTIDDGYDISKDLSKDLRNSLDKCLGSKGGGFDIEGLAAFHGKLYFGLRGPSGTDPTSKETPIAYIVETSTSPSASGQTAEDPFQVEVPPDAAIRDMAAVEGGILLLLGPNDDNAHIKWSISLWRVDNAADRKSSVKTTNLGELDLSGIIRSSCDDDVKPEGMAVLSEGAEGKNYRLAIFSDGMCDGGPVIVDVTAE